MTNSNPPSSRPMTLRQQLDALIAKYDDWHECEEWHIHDGSDEHEGVTPKPHDFDTDKFRTALESLCQEIAREARIDELKACLANVPMPTLSYEQVEGRIKQLNGLDKYGDVVEGELPIWKVSRKAELTQKPQGDSRE